MGFLVIWGVASGAKWSLELKRVLVIRTPMGELISGPRDSYGRSGLWNWSLKVLVSTLVGNLLAIRLLNQAPTNSGHLGLEAQCGL